MSCIASVRGALLGNQHVRVSVLPELNLSSALGTGVDLATAHNTFLRQVFCMGAWVHSCIVFMGLCVTLLGRLWEQHSATRGVQVMRGHTSE